MKGSGAELEAFRGVDLRFIHLVAINAAALIDSALSIARQKATYECQSQRILRRAGERRPRHDEVGRRPKPV